VTERIIRNDYDSYTLEETAKRYGLQKDMTVDGYIRANGLYMKREFMGEVIEKVPMYYKVPFKMLTRYAGMDAKLHLEIGLKQNERLI
jgi:molybdate-binding protein